MLFVKFFTFNPFQENTYVVYNDKGNAFIIDPGCYFNAEREMLKIFLEENNLTPVKLLNTHCHLDHVFGNKWIAETYHLELHVHANEITMLEFAPASCERFGLQAFENYKGRFQILQEGNQLNLDDDELEILFTPGHSTGSVSFYSLKQQFIISGDVLFFESIGRTDLPGGDFEVLSHSIKQKLYTLPDETIVYSGHGMPTTIGHEKNNNPYVK